MGSANAARAARIFGRRRMFDLPDLECVAVTQTGNLITLGPGAPRCQRLTKTRGKTFVTDRDRVRSNSMEALPLAFTSGWASGINAYACVLVLGLLGRFADVDDVPTA